MARQKIIELDKVSKSYRRGKRVLDSVTFSVNRGVIHGLIGPNGAGKSTIVSAICGLTNIDAGTIIVDSNNIRINPSFNKSLGVVFSDSQFTDNITVGCLIFDCARLRNIDKKKVLETLSNSKLFSYIHYRCRDLSSGWMKILQCFIANLYKPRLLILDEPFNAMSFDVKNILIDHLKKLRSQGVTIFISTHDLSDLQKIADEFTMVRNGKIIYTGPKTKDIIKFYKDLSKERSGWSLERLFG